MIKILMLIPYLSGYGGTESVIHNLVEEYNKRESNCHILIYSIGGFLRNNYLKFDNVKIIQFPNNSFLRKLLYIFLLPFIIPYLIIKIQPDIIISTTPIFWTLSKIFVDIIHIDVHIVAWYHYSFISKPVHKFFLEHADYFFTISEEGKRELVKLSVPSDDILVLYNPIYPSKHFIKNSRKHNQFIYIGRLEYNKQKNINELFRAFSLIRNDNWCLRIYGTGPDVNKLKLLSKKLGINKNIKWMGFVYNVWKHINNSDALVLTSNYEGLPMVLIEAISRGLYVISSNCDDGPSEIINNNNGSLYKAGNIIQLSGLLKMILNNRENHNKIKAKKSISRFYISNYFNRFIRFINIVNRNNKRGA